MPLMLRNEAFLFKRQTMYKIIAHTVASCMLLKSTGCLPTCWSVYWFTQRWRFSITRSFLMRSIFSVRFKSQFKRNTVNKFRINSTQLDISEHTESSTSLHSLKPKNVNDALNITKKLKLFHHTILWHERWVHSEVGVTDDSSS